MNISLLQSGGTCGRASPGHTIGTPPQELFTLFSVPHFYFAVGIGEDGMRQSVTSGVRFGNVCVYIVIPSNFDASMLHPYSVYVWAHRPGSRRTKADSIVTFFFVPVLNLRFAVRDLLLSSREGFSSLFPSPQ